MERIVFFDGHCNLCNAAVDYLIRHDPQRRLRFAPLSGETARERLGPGFTIAHPGTVVFSEDGRVFLRSTAALRALRSLGGRHRLWSVGFLFPKILRDGIYRFIARHRYGWFGRRETCRLPNEQERVLFLP